MRKPHIIGVYGTLKSNAPYALVNSNRAIYVQYAGKSTVRGRLYNNSKNLIWPVLVLDENAPPVDVEIYFMSDEEYKNTVKGEEANHYTTTKVRLVNGIEATMFVYTKNQVLHPDKVLGGTWLRIYEYPPSKEEQGLQKAYLKEEAVQATLDAMDYANLAGIKFKYILKHARKRITNLWR